MTPRTLCRRVLGTVLVAVAVARPAAAQYTARADVTMGGRHVWHGLSRAAGLVLQPSIGFGLRSGQWSADGGLVRNYELDRVVAGELSQAGVGGGRLGEDDLWARTTLDLREMQVSLGVARYVFRGRASAGGMGSDRSTTEIFGTLSPKDLYLNPSLEAWVDVGRVRGVYFRASTHMPVLAYPLQPFVFVYLETELGLNVGQGPNSSRPLDLANFAERGITHAGFGATVERRQGHWPGVGLWLLSAGARLQLNFDEATRFNGENRSADFSVWLWAGTTVVLGRDVRDVR
jgi:hypothetical protein